MRQPGMFAWQVFDAKARRSCAANTASAASPRRRRTRWRSWRQSSKASIRRRFLRTVRAYNAACTSDVPFNPNILDGRSTKGLAIEKTNWAVALDTPPFHAYHVTTGVTFTFGGVKISRQGEVEDLYGRTIPGLYAAGEMVGGLFFHNYASGTGLMSGATFGRLAGRNAAAIRGRAGAASGRRNGSAIGAAMLDRAQTTAAQQLAEFAVALRYEDLPASVVASAKHCLIDAIACAVFGRKLPWSQMVLEEALGDRSRGTVPAPRCVRTRRCTCRRRRSRSAPFRMPSSSTICASLLRACMAAPPSRCRPSPWRRLSTRAAAISSPRSSPASR